MEITVTSIKKLVGMTKRFKAEQDDVIVILLLLQTEENIQEFFAWAEQQDELTPQKCLEKAVMIAGPGDDD